MNQDNEPASESQGTASYLTEPSSARNKVGKFLEHFNEQTLFSARWLLAPLYLGLALSLCILVFKFMQYFFEVMKSIATIDMHTATLEILQLLDITLLGNLIIIVIFSGYENFVSKIHAAEGSTDRPSWMGRVDYSGLKIKLIGSLVAISVIELLRDFMNAEHMDTETIKWRILIHLTFIVSGVLFAVMDYIADKRALVEIEIEQRELQAKKLKHEVAQLTEQ